MSPAAFLVTSLLLGFMVLAAGAYALLYSAACFRESRALLIAAGLGYAMLALDVAVIVLATALAPAWKLLIATSGLAYLVIPPLTWRFAVHAWGGRSAPMIANLLNTLVGLWLTYAAIFPHAAGMARDRVALIAAIAMIGLALWERRSGAGPWQSVVSLATGAFLAALMITDLVVHVSDVAMFWGVLWAGLVSATVSLWAALYRPSQDAGFAG